MALRFFADHCISNFIIKTLQDGGNEVFRLRDYISTDSADQIVISKAQELDPLAGSILQIETKHFALGHKLRTIATFVSFSKHYGSGCKPEPAEKHTPSPSF